MSRSAIAKSSRTLLGPGRPTSPCKARWPIWRRTPGTQPSRTSGPAACLLLAVRGAITEPSSSACSSRHPGGSLAASEAVVGMAAALAKVVTTPQAWAPAPASPRTAARGLVGRLHPAHWPHLAAVEGLVGHRRPAHLAAVGGRSRRLPSRYRPV